MAQEVVNDAYDEVIDKLQEQIEERTNGNSDWKFDPDGWKTMPAFMDEITEEDVLTNPQCAGLSSLVYDGVPPEEIAEGRKKIGNESIVRALDPNQENRSNWARQAIYAYTEGIDQGCQDHVLNAQLYGNRSMANFLLENFGRGLADAQRAILMDPTYVKAYYRGAKCAERIRKFKIAKSLIEKGLALNPDDKVKAEFQVVIDAVKRNEDGLAAAEKKAKLQSRVAAAESNNLYKAITSKGIRVGARPEIQSEQWNQLRQEKPFFDAEGTLHTPILFMYDEYNTTDFLKDVPADCSLMDCMGTLMPFPWDEKGRYQNPEDLVAVFFVDVDGVKMPEYHVADMNWTLFEVYRTKEYLMPAMLPVFHIVPKDSDMLKQWNIKL